MKFLIYRVELKDDEDRQMLAQGKYVSNLSCFDKEKLRLLTYLASKVLEHAFVHKT